ncbi:MAG: orotate phosphoribosyltransferase [Pseudomonadota bacterium]
MADELNNQPGAFIEFMLAQNVLKFGEFTLNSGRLSPYFFNLGAVNGGAAFARLGEAYAQAILATGTQFDVLFGPAYKGIPIAVATAIALAERGVEVGVAYNRKEAKDHGEGGQLVGAEVAGRVMLIDDVLTSGKAIRQASALITQTHAQIVGAVIALDRQEINERGVTAVDELARELGAPVTAIANMADVIGYLDGGAENGEALARMRAYQAEYCQAS